MFIYTIYFPIYLSVDLAGAKSELLFFVKFNEIFHKGMKMIPMRSAARFSFFLTELVLLDMEFFLDSLLSLEHQP